MPTSPHFPVHSGPVEVTLLDSVASTIRRAASKVLGQRHPDLDDTVQEAMLAFLAAWGAFRAECHPAGYARRIATREAIRTLRRERQRLRKIQHLARSTPEEAATSPDTLPDPRRARLIAELLDVLPRTQRDALVQRVVVELSLDEVAALTGAPQNTVRSRVRMARDALKSHLAARPSLAMALSLA